MGSLTLTISYAKNTGLVFNSTELKNLYFTGIALQDQFGNPIAEDTIDFYTGASQKEVENDLSVKFTRQAYFETRDFVFDDYINWMYIPISYPAEKGLSVQGFLNSSLQINYPKEWISTKSQGGDKDVYWRSLNMLPLQGPSATTVGNAGLVGITPYLGLLGNRQIPNYWTAKYVTGYQKIPLDILNYVGRTAAVNLFINLGDIITGIPGVVSKSISIDGLSQNVGTMRGFLNRIEQYRRDLERQRLLLKTKYSSFSFGAL